METTQKPKSAFYKTFKKPEDMADILSTVYRAVKYEKSRHTEISKLCGDQDITTEEGNWVIEEPRPSGPRKHTFMTDVEFHSTFVPFDARGILGCGEGSERFGVKKKH